MSLFGFDVITQVETGNHAVVDINYFPSKPFIFYSSILTVYSYLGYGGVKDFWQIFGDYILRKARTKVSSYSAQQEWRTEYLL
jgi:hypothetical protein